MHVGVEINNSNISIAIVLSEIITWKDGPNQITDKILIMPFKAVVIQANDSIQSTIDAVTVNC